MGFSLTITRGLEVGRQYAFDQAEVAIGRFSEGDVILQEAGVSRKHARILEEDGRWIVEDLGSANGTKVNGKRIDGRRELKSGDVISLGPVSLDFASAPTEDEAPPADANATRMVDVEEIARKAAAAAEAKKRDRVRAADDLNERTESFPEEDPSVAENTSPGAAQPAEEAPPEEANATLLGLPSFAAEKLAAANAAAEDPNATRIKMNPLAEEAPPEDPNATRIKTNPLTAGELATDVKGKRPANLAKGGPSSVIVDPDQTSPMVRASKELAGRGNEKAAKAKEPEPPVMSAAERMRLKRQYGDSLVGQLQFLWAQQTPKGKLISGSVISAFSLAVVIGLGALFWPEDTGPRLPDEPAELTRRPIPYRFGLGVDVDYEREDMKIFQFSFATPTRAVAVLRYMSREISPDEVSVVVNGIEQAKLAPDTEDSGNHELQIVLAGEALKRNEMNTVTFDNVKNPPGEDPWQIWNVSLEVVPVPELPDAELLVSAREYAERGKALLERRDVGPDNLFKAWKAYRQAWITLEALSQKPELYQLVRFQMANIGKELDRHCNRLMLEAEKSLRLRQRTRARQTLESVPRYFPTTEHRCHNLAIARLEEHEL